MEKVDLKLMWSLYHNLGGNHAVYRYGMKPPLDADSHTITGSDCSGLSRYLCSKASGGKLLIPDGSQMQREWFEQSGAHKLARYSDILMADESRLFIHFIKPYTNGCGRVGHVFFTSKPPGHTQPLTIEAHGPENAQIQSRSWDYATLVREWYNGFEIPTIANG